MPEDMNIDFHEAPQYRYVTLHYDHSCIKTPK
jgi:hypothetical protein